MELDAKLEKCASSFEGRLSSVTASPSTSSTLEQLAAEFTQFKVSMTLSIELIRTQVAHMTAAIDEMENRSRRKFLLFRGINECQAEDLKMVLSDVIVNKMEIKEFNPSCIRFCYRLGKDISKTSKRPILVRFQSIDIRSRIWQSKKSLKGADISIAEHLTVPRRAIFNEARKVYGVHKCWSQDGSVYLLTADGIKHRLVSQVQLQEIMRKFPPSKTGPAPGKSAPAPAATAATKQAAPAVAAPSTRVRVPRAK